MCARIPVAGHHDDRKKNRDLKRGDERVVVPLPIGRENRRLRIRAVATAQEHIGPDVLLPFVIGAMHLWARLHRDCNSR